ncbi:hypothetical protein B0H14DRAFT_2595373 [Mycena olivaceomarginata]|nr:hypothetical protein B0H14DRAFT_2595373 [Mycena olivaceomarginata]
MAGYIAIAEGSCQNKVAVAYISDPGECFGTSPLKPGQVNDLIPHLPVDHAPELQEPVATVESQSETSPLNSVEDGPRTPKVAVAYTSDPGACNAWLPPPSGRVPVSDLHVLVDPNPVQKISYSAQKQARLAKKKKREAERKQTREALMVVWAVIEKNSATHGTSSFRRLIRRIKSRAERTRKILLCRWYNTPWDMEGAPVVVVDSSDSKGEVLLGSPSRTADGKVSIQEVEDRGDILGVKVRPLVTQESAAALLL